MFTSIPPLVKARSFLEVDSMKGKLIERKLKKIPTWQTIARGMFEISGWEMMEDKPNKKKFVRGNETIIALRIDKNKWKAEYLVNNKLEDVTA